MDEDEGRSWGEERGAGGTLVREGDELHSPQLYRHIRRSGEAGPVCSNRQFAPVSELTSSIIPVNRRRHQSAQSTYADVAISPVNPHDRTIGKSTFPVLT